MAMLRVAAHDDARFSYRVAAGFTRSAECSGDAPRGMALAIAGFPAAVAALLKWLMPAASQPAINSRLYAD